MGSSGYCREEVQSGGIQVQIYTAGEGEMGHLV